MTPEQMTAARKRLNLTQAKLGEELGHHQVTIARYESGKLAIPQHVEAYFTMAIGLQEATATHKPKGD